MQKTICQDEVGPDLYEEYYKLQFFKNYSKTIFPLELKKQFII